MSDIAASSDWLAALGVRVPMVCAPMGGVAGGRLAAAISQAGALGMIGMGSAGSAAALERELAALHEYRAEFGPRAVPVPAAAPTTSVAAAAPAEPATPAPFGIGLVGWGVERHPDMLELALAAQPTLLSVSFSDWSAPPPGDWVARAHRAGIAAITQVATADEAHLAMAAGVDAVVARGFEGGGHGDHQRPRRTLLTEVLDAVGQTDTGDGRRSGSHPGRHPRTPVLSAGAIATADDLAEALAAGAAGVWVGTAFSACPEALTPAAAREVLFAARTSDTFVSRVLDVALGLPWPERFPERLLRTPFVERWHGRETELAGDAAARSEFRAAAAAGDFAVVPLDAGMGVDELREARPAADVVRSLTEAPT